MTIFPRSLQGRLLILVLIAVAGIWLVVAAITWRDTRHELDELLDSHLAQAAALLVAQQAGEIDDTGHSVDAPILHRYAPTVVFQIFHEGRVVLRSANAPAAPLIAPATGFKTGFETVQIQGATWRVFAAYGAERDVQVYVGERTANREEILWAVLRSMLWPMLFALPLLAAAVGLAVYRGMKPLRTLRSTLAERRPQELRPIAIPDAAAEITPIVDALNGLFQRIDQLLESERRFTADAAHELRTPIAAIRAQAQVALGESNDALRTHALQRTIEGCDRATRLVEQLLTLSRLDAAAPTMDTLDFGAVARRAVAELAPKAVEKNQTVEFEAHQICNATGNEALLEVLVRNLVDNAIRYSPPTARVRVGVQKTAGKIVLSVEDSGPGLAEPDRRRLGERFFRVAGSGESGSGLGWSIVRRIAAVHAFDLEVDRSVELGGLLIRVIAEAPLERMVQ